jgi:hypothetical protein
MSAPHCDELFIAFIIDETGYLLGGGGKRQELRRIHTHIWQQATSIHASSTMPTKSRLDVTKLSIRRKPIETNPLASSSFQYDATYDKAKMTKGSMV